MQFGLVICAALIRDPELKRERVEEHRRQGICVYCWYAYAGVSGLYSPTFLHFFGWAGEV
jgi:hypothetical protein